MAIPLIRRGERLPQITIQQESLQMADKLLSRVERFFLAILLCFRRRGIFQFQNARRPDQLGESFCGFVRVKNGVAP
jgi:hypothetical protein